MGRIRKLHFLFSFVHLNYTVLLTIDTVGGTGECDDDDDDDDDDDGDDNDDDDDDD